MRPRTLAEFAGQRHLLDEGILSDILAHNQLPSLILWGPPGCGKTTLAHLLADHIDAEFTPLSAILATVKDLRQAIDQAKQLLRMMQRSTILFVDEIHRFNKSQQDALLPHVEQGDVILLGATTENPGFEVNHALRSRTHVLRLEPLDEDALAQILQAAIEDRERGLGAHDLTLSDEARDRIIEMAAGDARAALSTLEVAARRAWARTHLQQKEEARVQSDTQTSTILQEDIQRALHQPRFGYDKKGAHHHNITSALIKSLRGSDPDAALYYMWRMLEAGEDPMFILRRLLIFASEDVGLANSQALTVVTSAMQATHQVGMPEAGYILTHAALYLALSPKSHSVTRSMYAAKKLVHAAPAAQPPTHLQNPSPTGDYRSPHESPTGFLNDVDYLPQEVLDRARAMLPLYRPFTHGEEPALRSWLDHEQ